jgi:hypothetical protein
MTPDGAELGFLCSARFLDSFFGPVWLGREGQAGEFASVSLFGTGPEARWFGTSLLLAKSGPPASVDEKNHV